MGLTQLNFEGRDKVQVAIMRLKEFEPPEGYYLAFSGGKDSVVLYDLALKANIKFDSHHNMIGCEPTQIIRFIRQYFPSVALDHSPYGNFWIRTITNGYPTRIARWCCKEFKEIGGENRLVLTGVRWEESARRKSRRMLESCWATGKNKRFLHPIIDWDTQDIWQYIRAYKVPYCSLYDEGMTRIGCVLCPLASNEKRLLDLQRFPEICKVWHSAFERMYAWKVERNLAGAKRFKSAEEMWQYWLANKYDDYDKAEDGATQGAFA